MASKKLWIRLAAISGFLAVALGAFGAHALKAKLEAAGYMDTWKTATLYHMVHSVVLLLPWGLRDKLWSPNLLFTLGILLFSGSLYLLCLTGVGVLGAVTPLGGVCFLSGWFWLAVKPLGQEGVHEDS